MEAAIDDDTIVYNQIYRCFAYYIHRELPSFQTISFCPFCGTKLPTDLDGEFDSAVFEILGQTGMELIAAHKSFINPNKKLPQEFQTDEWWKTRGL
jgi:hypothetical protein